MFGTIKNKRITLLGWTFKKDTTDTRETPSNDVARGLLSDGAKVVVYDPRAPADVICRDVAAPVYHWDRPHAGSPSVSANTLNMWDEFSTYDYQRIFSSMTKPAFVFDGRNILDHKALRAIGFIVYGLGRPLDPYLTEHMEGSRF
eukprot:gene12173-15291_t